jgi:hypothetical protein
MSSNSKLIQGTSAPTGPSLPLARRTEMLFNSLIGNFQYPQNTPYDLPTSNREIGLRVIASLVVMNSGSLNPRILIYRYFGVVRHLSTSLILNPIGKSRIGISRFLLLCTRDFQFPESRYELPPVLCSSACGPHSCGDREIAYRDIAISIALVHGTLQVPIPDARESLLLHVTTSSSLYRVSRNRDS